MIYNVQDFSVNYAAMGVAEPPRKTTFTIDAEIVGFSFVSHCLYTAGHCDFCLGINTFYYIINLCSQSFV